MAKSLHQATFKLQLMKFYILINDNLHNLKPKLSIYIFDVNVYSCISGRQLKADKETGNHKIKSKTLNNQFAKKINTKD